MEKKICLPGSPLSTNHIYKFHSKGGYMTKEGKALKEEYQYRAKVQWPYKVLTKKIEVIIELYFGDRRRRDVDNYTKILLDSLQGIVYKDDVQIHRMTISKYYDKNLPRAEIEIKEL